MEFGEEMDNIDKEQLVVNMILKEIKNILLKIRHQPDDENSIQKYGHPTKKAIVKYFAEHKKDGEPCGEIISVWRVSSDKIDLINDKNIKPKYEPKSGMYYCEGSFNFSISSDLSDIFLEMIIGPRYGRGYIYKVAFYDTGGVRIWCDKTLWVS